MYVGFFDVLGFGDAVAACTDQEFKEIAGILERNPRIGTTKVDFGKDPQFLNAQRVYDLFAGFQSMVEAVDGEKLASGLHVFSDSMFARFDAPQAALDFSAALMQDSVSDRVPIRGGLATGSFLQLEVGVRRFPNGEIQVQCPFFGAGVVRAYRAERCGLKGLRVFVHPTAVEEMGESFQPRLLPLSTASANASHEVNLIHYDWSQGGKTFYMDTEAEAFEHRKLALSEMAKSAPSAAKIHYEDSIRALDRMLEATPFGPPPRWSKKSFFDDR